MYRIYEQAAIDQTQDTVIGYLLRVTKYAKYFQDIILVCMGIGDGAHGWYRNYGYGQ